MAKLYDVKVFFSGNVIEIYKYSETRSIGYSRAEKTVKTEGKKIIDFEAGEIIAENGTKLDSRARSNIRARNTVRRLVLENFDKSSKFMTLTFKENLQDLEEANRCFKSFVRLVNKELKKKDKPNMKYIAVIEHQERGAIHYHVICDLKGYSSGLLWKQWKKATGEHDGGVDITRITHVDNIGAYVTKYMVKDLKKADERLIGKKVYQTTKGLDKPKELGLSFRSEKDRQIYEDLIKGKKITYSSEYDDLHTGGTVEYMEINLNRQQN